MNTDAFARLGLTPGSTAADVRAARRRLAKAHHPDAGGDAATMRSINEAAAAALALIDDATRQAPGSEPRPSRTHGRNAEPDIDASASTTRDTPSFVVDALPVETFELLLVATTWLGEVVDDDPPYRLDTLLAAPSASWCRLDVVPDAGSSTVSITLGRLDDDTPLPAIESVRDAWIDAINRVGAEPPP